LAIGKSTIAKGSLRNDVVDEDAKVAMGVENL
jgi:hypothetical protein